MAKIGMRSLGRRDEFRLEHDPQHEIAEHDEERRAEGRGGEAGIEGPLQRRVGGVESPSLAWLLAIVTNDSDDRLAEHGEALPQHVGDDAIGTERGGAEIVGEQQPVDALADRGDAEREQQRPAITEDAQRGGARGARPAEVAKSSSATARRR